ncbi:MAG: hypothetical protein IPK13_02100 [Deltaproteobacteria bacterium]|nr:hypothetical protein [Deltaproteobacteria bacterium]
MVRMYHLLSTSEEIEETAAKIYDVLARRVACLPRGSAPWPFDVPALLVRLADEERQHRLRIRSFAQSFRRERAAVDSQDYDTGDLDKLLSDGETLLHMCSDEARSIDVSDAFHLAMALEESFARVHAHVLAEHAWPAARVLFSSLAAQDRGHIALLRHAQGELAAAGVSVAAVRAHQDSAASASSIGDRRKSL